MAKLTTNDLTNLSSEASAVTNVNNNFAAVETSLENTLSRDGTSPNEMEADFDMNFNDILNVNALYTQQLIINGSPVTVDTSYIATIDFATLLSVAVLRLQTTVTMTKNYVMLKGWHAGSGVGGGFFYYDTGDTTTADNEGTVIVDASSRRWKRLTPAQLTPLEFGAKGDGSTSDNAAYLAYEAVVTHTFLPDGYTFNFTAGALPVDLVSGSGKIAIAGTTLDRLDMRYDVKRSNVLFAPEMYATKIIGRTSTPPGTNNYFNTIIGQNSNAYDTTKSIWRNVLIGTNVGTILTEAERNIAIGDGALRFAKYANRCTAIGTLTLQWLGQTLTDDPTYFEHDFWTQAQLPGVAGWNFHGLEGMNPGVGAAIAAWNTWATNTDQVVSNDAFSRDALLHLLKGVDNTATGYRSLADLYEGSFNAAYGNDCLFRGVWLNGTTGMGVRCAEQLQEGSGSVVAGYRLGLDLVKSSNSVLIGTLSGGTYWQVDNCVFLGAASGQDLFNKAITGATQANPGVITSAAHGYTNGTKVYIRDVGGMVELNNTHYLIANATTNTFTLQTLAGVGVNTTAYTAYTSGGIVNKSVLSKQVAIRTGTTDPHALYIDASATTGSWSVNGNPQWTNKVLTASQTVTNSTTFTNITGLGIAVLTGETWKWEYDIPMSEFAAEDFKIQLTGPATSLVNNTFSYLAADATAWAGVNHNVFSSSVSVLCATGGPGRVRISGIGTFTADGTVMPQFAQVTSGANPATVRIGAEVYYKKIA